MNNNKYNYSYQNISHNIEIIQTHSKTHKSIMLKALL